MVFPTRVGMFRSQSDIAFADSRFPHTRGDVPASCQVLIDVYSFSPHAWGCSGNHELRHAGR